MNANKLKTNPDGPVENPPPAAPAGTTQNQLQKPDGDIEYQLQKPDGHIESQSADTAGNSSATVLGNKNP